MVDGGYPAELIKAFLPDADLHLIRASATENRIESSPLTPADTRPGAAQTRRVADVVSGHPNHDANCTFCAWNTSLEVCPNCVSQADSFECTFIPAPAQQLVVSAIGNDRLLASDHVDFAPKRSTRLACRSAT